MVRMDPNELDRGLKKQLGAEVIRQPLVRSERSNGVAAHRNRIREVSSRYMSTSISAPKSEKGSLAPVSRLTTSSASVEVPKRAVSAERKRPSTPSSRQSTPVRDTDVSLAARKLVISTQPKSLWPSTMRSLNGSFQSDGSPSPTAKKEKPVAYSLPDRSMRHSLKASYKIPESPPSTRKSTPERKRSPLKGKSLLDQAENAKPSGSSQIRLVDQQRWPSRIGGKISSDALNQTVDFTDKIIRNSSTPLSRSSRIPSLSRLSDVMSKPFRKTTSEAITQKSTDWSTLERKRPELDSPTDRSNFLKSPELRKPTPINLGSKISMSNAEGRSETLPGSRQPSPIRTASQSKAASPSHFERKRPELDSPTDDHSNLLKLSELRKPTPLNSPNRNTLARSQSLSGSRQQSPIRTTSQSKASSPFHFERKRPELDSPTDHSNLLKFLELRKPTPLNSPNRNTLARSQSLSRSRYQSPIRTTSQSKVSTPSHSRPATPIRGLSPSRIRPVSSSSQSSSSNSVLSFITDFRKPKKNNQLEDAHQLRLLYNRHLQFRFANARTDDSSRTQKLTAERNLNNVWRTNLALRDLVIVKKIRLQQMRLELKLNLILKEQLHYLDDWESLERDHSLSLAGIIKDLEASTLRLPLTGGARADIESLKVAVGSAMDVMRSIGPSVITLLLRAEGMNSLVSRLANLTLQERAMLAECKRLLALNSAMQVEENSLRTHLIQTCASIDRYRSANTCEAGDIHDPV